MCHVIGMHLPVSYHNSLARINSGFGLKIRFRTTFPDRVRSLDVECLLALVCAIHSSRFTGEAFWTVFSQRVKVFRVNVLRVVVV